MTTPKDLPPVDVDLDINKSRLFATCCAVPGFEFRWTDGLMLTAHRLHDARPDWWNAFVVKYDIDAENQRKIYGIGA